MTRTAIASLIAATGLAIALPVVAQTHDERRADDDRRHAAAAAQADPRFRANSASLDSILADAQKRHPGRVIDVNSIATSIAPGTCRIDGVGVSPK